MREPAKKVVKLRYIDSEPGEVDPSVKTLMQGWEYTADGPLWDGPVSTRVAIVDIDPETSAIVPGATYVPPNSPSLGRYVVANPLDPETPDFMQVSVFSAVMRMITLFEKPDVLGRKLRWAFSGEQLLVVPRAGKMPNAFYHRGSRSLQFFFVDDPERPGRLVYSCLAPDIVAHETTHAILDGIAPDLYDASSPQSLAMHEAIADLGAVLLSVRTDRLIRKVLAKTEGDISRDGAFAEIAKRFGTAAFGRPIRDLDNQLKFPDPRDRKRNQPHELSLVLTGAIYRMLVVDYQNLWRELADDCLAKAEAKLEAEGKPPASAEERHLICVSASGAALFKATDKMKRVAFRALDYLPPGEISFADYGRAIIAADAYSNPDDPGPRDLLKEEFVRRGIVAARSALDPVDPGFELPSDCDLELLRDDYGTAEDFVKRHRTQLCVPSDVTFHVRPRLDVTRKTWRKGNETGFNRVLLLKVAWAEKQDFTYGELVKEIEVQKGTTLAIDWETRDVCTLLTTNPSHLSQGDGSASRDEQMRAAFLTECLEEGLLELQSAEVELEDRTLRVRGLGQMLHVTGHDHGDDHVH